MYLGTSGGICDPVNGTVHAVLRFPLVGAVLAAVAGGGYAYSCLPERCDGNVRIVQNANGEQVEVCEEVSRP